MFKESDQIEKFEPKVWLSSPTMHGEEFEFLKEAYETNWMSTVGANINEVERLVCKKIGCKYAVGLSAGTAALHMAVKLAGVKPGEKVFCSDMTFSATVNPIVYEGGVPVFIDTEYDTSDHHNIPAICMVLLFSHLCHPCSLKSNIAISEPNPCNQAKLHDCSYYIIRSRHSLTKHRNSYIKKGCNNACK